MICKKCEFSSEDRTLFALFKQRNGTPGRRHICKPCRAKWAEDNFERQQAYRHEYNIKNKTKKQERDQRVKRAARDFVWEIKARSPCADCKQQFHPVAMEFDHIGAKNKNVSALVSGAYKLELIKAEIALCEVVCSNCHHIRTWTRGQSLYGKEQK